MKGTNPRSKKWTPHRQMKLDRVVQIAGWLLFAASVICWLFDRVPTWVPVILCSIPWLALAAATFGGGRFQLLGPDGKTIINFVLMVPLGLTIGALLRFNIIDWERGLIVACLGGALYVAGCYVAVRATVDHPTVARRIPRMTVRDLILVLFVAFIGSSLTWATIVFVNALQETQPPITLVGKVVAKSFSGGRGHFYYLHYSGQPSTLGIDGFRVSKGMYDHARIGQAGYIMVRSGWLGMRHYAVTDC